MQQSKPPIAAKPKIPMSHRFPVKKLVDPKNDNIQIENLNLKCDFENKLTFPCDYAKKKVGVQSGSQSFENLYLKSNGTNKFSDENQEAVKKYESNFNNKTVRENIAGNSQVQQMKSKLFAQQSEVFKQNQNDVSADFNSNKIQQKKYSKELEKILGMRNHLNNVSSTDNGKVLKRLSRSFDESLSEDGWKTITDVPVEKVSIQNQQKVLAAEIKHVQSEIRKNSYCIVSVQHRYDEKNEVNKSIRKSFKSLVFCKIHTDDTHPYTRFKFKSFIDRSSQNYSASSTNKG